MSQMTKRALEASLKELLHHKPLDKITVSDLTDHCGVNRMTFYYHFKDIYDLVEWCCEEDAARAADILWEDYGICVRAGAHCAPLIHKALGTVEQGMVRFSFSHQNTEAEVLKAAEAVCELAEEG